MTILNRPLFRQAGGPIQPEPMMAPPMDPAMDPMMQAVGDAEMQGAQIGEQYMADTMQNLDMAESPKEVIDAIRGNARPLEARYQELATFVGEEDALQTPESVLAMVQPTIMMSEEGAMDTGIAELMQGMMGDVEMAPGSEMAEGVGSLMMAGASEAPAPQNFNQGGAVRLQEGGDVGILQALMAASQPPTAETVKGYYESLLPMYQEILGRDEEAREASRAAGFFDIAQAGLNLASGIDPRTGRSTAGQSFASQLASAASGLPERFAERAAEERRAEQALRASALQTAMQQAQGSQDFQQQLSLLAAKEAMDPSAFKSEVKLLAMTEEQGGGVKPFNVDTASGFEAYEKAMKQGAMPYEKPTAGDSRTPQIRVITDTVTGVRTYPDINTPEGAAQVAAANKANEDAEQNLFTVNTVASDPGARSAQAYLIDGVGTFLSYDGGRTYQNKDNVTVPMPVGAAPLSDTITYNVMATESKRRKAGEKLRELTGFEADAPQDAVDSAVIISSARGGERGAPTALTTEENTDLQEILKATTPDAMAAAQRGTGPYAFIRAMIDSSLGGLGVPFTSMEDTQTARQVLRGIKVLGRSALVVNPRFPVAEMENVAELLPNPDAFLTRPGTEANKFIELKALATNQLLRNLSEIEGGISQDLIPDIEANNRELERLLGLLSSVPSNYQGQAQQNAVVDALRSGLRTNKSTGL